MRKILSVLLVSLLIFSFAACGSGKKIFHREAVRKARKLLHRKAAGRMIFHTRKIFRMRSRLWD